MNKSILLFLILISGCAALISNNTLVASETLTVTVLIPSSIEEGVKQISKGGYIVGFRLVCVTTSSDTVIDRVFTEGFNSGESPARFRLRIGNKMQDAIDEYQARHTIFNSSAYTATPAILAAGLDGGV